MVSVSVAQVCGLVCCSLSILGLGGCMGDADRGERAVKDLREAVEEGDAPGRAPLRIADHASFQWDRLMVAGPFSDGSGYGYRLRFLDDGSVVEEATGDIGANLDCLVAVSGGVPRQDAVVRVFAHKYRSGGIYRLLIPAWGGPRGARAARRCRANHGPFD